MGVSIEPMKANDWPEVRAIYAEGIESGNATFETDSPEWERWDTGHMPNCRIVARSDGAVVGWAALSPVSRRPVYSGVAELSIYVSDRALGQGIGSRLMAAVIEASEREGIWTLCSSTFPENSASLALQRRFGFRVIGMREKIACHRGQWRDTVLLERRSRVVGA
jgi:phosphinothricin acetyltransferase